MSYLKARPFWYIELRRQMKKDDIIWYNRLMAKFMLIKN